MDEFERCFLFCTPVRVPQEGSSCILMDRLEVDEG